MKKRLLLITGSPGVGKTTLLLKVIEALRAKGYRVGGMISREVRISGSRVGFEVTNLNSDKKGWLASVHQELGPKVGKYRVDIDDLNQVGVKAILEAYEKLDVVVIDEIGPMELFSEQFRETVKKAVESKKLVISTIHQKMGNQFVDSIKKREDAEVHILSNVNNEDVLEAIIRDALDFLSKVDAE